MAGSTSNLKVVGPVQNIGSGGGLNIIGKYPDDINKAKAGEALIDNDGNIWVNNGQDWVQVNAGKDGVGIPEGGQDGQFLIKEGTENYKAKWGDVEFSSDAGNLVDLDKNRKALRKPKDGEEVVLPLDKVVMYVGLGTPADYPEITDAKTGSLFTSTSGDGFFFKDADAWGLVGGSDEAPELPDDLVTQDDLEGLATEEYVDDANADTLEYVDNADADTLKASKEYTDEKIAEGIEGEISLDGYATVVQVSEGDAKTLEDANAYTDAAVSNIDIPDVELPDDLVTQDDLQGLATEEYVNTAIDNIEIPEVPPLPDELVYEDDLEDFATKEYVDGAVDAIDIPNSYTKDEANKRADEMDQSLRENIKYEAASAVEDANAYTDEQIGGIEIPEVPPLPDDLVKQEDLQGLATEEYVDTAVDAIDIPELPDLSYLDELQKLAVVGNYKLNWNEELWQGHVRGRKASDGKDQVMSRWVSMEVSLQDLNSYVSNNWLNAKQDWIVEFHSKPSDGSEGPVTAKWRVTSEPQRNGDKSLDFAVEWVDGEADWNMFTAGELYVHDGSGTPHFPVRSSRFDQLVEHTDETAELLQGQINDLVVEGADLFRVAGQWDFRPLTGNSTLEDGFVRIDAPGMWYTWEDPSVWTHITIPLKDQNNKTHPGLENIGAGEVIEYKGMHSASWITQRPPELIEENGVTAYKFQVTFVAGTNEGSRLVDGLLLNKYSGDQLPDGGGSDVTKEYVDDADTSVYENAKTYTDEQIAALPDSGNSSEVTKDYVDTADAFLQEQIDGLQTGKLWKLFAYYNFDYTKDAFSDRGVIWPDAPGTGDENLDPNTWTHVNIPYLDLHNADQAARIASIAVNDVSEYHKGVDGEGVMLLVKSAPELESSYAKIATKKLMGTTNANDLVGGYLGVVNNTASDNPGGDDPDAPIPDDPNVPKLDQENVFTVKQRFDQDSLGQAIIVARDGSNNLEIWSDGRIKQLGGLENKSNSDVVTRGNIKNLFQQKNTFKDTQTFRAADGADFCTTLNAYAPSNNGGDLEIFGISVVPANPNKAAERDTESTIHYRGRTDHPTSLVNNQFVVDKIADAVPDDIVSQSDLDAYVKKNGNNELTGPFKWKPPHHSEGNLRFELYKHTGSVLFGSAWMDSEWTMNYWGPVTYPKHVATKEYVDSKLVPELPDDIVTGDDLESLPKLDEANTFTADLTVKGAELEVRDENNQLKCKIFPTGLIKQYDELGNTHSDHVVNRKNLTDAIDALDIPDSSDFVTQEQWDARDVIWDDIFEDIDDTLKDLRTTDQGQQTQLDEIKQGAAYLDKLNRFTKNQTVDVPDSIAFSVKQNNQNRLSIWATGEVQQNTERSNTHEWQFQTKKNVDDIIARRDQIFTEIFDDIKDTFDSLRERITELETKDLRPFTWADHTVAADLNPGECFISSSGYLYTHVNDANGKPLLFGDDSDYVFTPKSLIYYVKEDGEEVCELFSVTQVDYHTNSYIRFMGEEEVHPDWSHSGMAFLRSPLFS